MTPRQHCLACLQRNPPSAFEAALWVSAEHEPGFSPSQALQGMEELARQVSAALPMLPASELAQPLLRRLIALGFQQDDWAHPKPDSALLHMIIERRRGQPLGLAMIALEIARRLEIPLEGVNFPGHFLLRVPGADHALDPCDGRRLYPKDCRELLIRQFGPDMQLKSLHGSRDRRGDAAALVAQPQALASNDQRYPGVTQGCRPGTGVGPGDHQRSPGPGQLVSVP